MASRTNKSNENTFIVLMLYAFQLVVMAIHIRYLYFEGSLWNLVQLCERLLDRILLAHISRKGAKRTKVGGAIQLLGSKIVVFQVCFIRCRWNFERMVLVWKYSRLISLVTCFPTPSRECPAFRPKSGHICSQNMSFSIHLEYNGR